MGWGSTPLRHPTRPPSGRYRDLARPVVLLVHCAGAMGLGFGTVVISDTEPKPQ